jgi:hypothetical protein
MTIAGIRTALETALATISGLKAFDFAPNAINELPAAYVDIIDTAYHLDAGGDTVLTVEIVLLASRANGIEAAQSTIDEYIEKSGTKSIPAAIEAATLSTHADTIIGLRWEKVRGGITVNGETYQGGRFHCKVTT